MERRFVRVSYIKRPVTCSWRLCIVLSYPCSFLYLLRETRRTKNSILVKKVRTSFTVYAVSKCPNKFIITLLVTLLISVLKQGKRKKNKIFYPHKLPRTHKKNISHYTPIKINMRLLTIVKNALWTASEKLFKDCLIKVCERCKNCIFLSSHIVKSFVSARESGSGWPKTQRSKTK